MENASIQQPPVARGASKRTPPRPPTSAAAPEPAAPALPYAPLGDLGLSRAPDGGYLVADTFSFRQQVRAAVMRPGVKQELLDALQEAWTEPAELRAALLPTRSLAGPGAAAAGAGAASYAFDGGFKDSFVRLLLQCDDLQTDLASMLLERLAELQDELEHGGGGGAAADGGHSSSRMPLPKLVLSQFRWLEHVASSAAPVSYTHLTLPTKA